MKEIEVRTKFPTPQDFFGFVDQLSNRLRDREGIRRLRALYPEPKLQPGLDSNTPPVTLYLVAEDESLEFHVWTNKDDVGIGKIKIVAEIGPQNTTILTVSAANDVWKKVSPNWDRLYAEMEQRGWLGMQSEREATQQGQPMTSNATGEKVEAKPRRGGPVPLSDEEKIKIVREWYAVQGKENQEAFCHRKGIGTSTLRGYMRDLKAKRKLPPS